MIGSQAYYSNEIIAEIYAQALEGAGFTVERDFSIGQRDAYLPALESGEVDLFPEYTGNLLQFYDPETTATTSEDVYAALQEALPEGLEVLEQSSATDQDSYNVTAAFADEQNLTSLADLAAVTVPLTLGGAPELEERPYGPDRAAGEVRGERRRSRPPVTRPSRTCSRARSTSPTSTAPTRASRPRTS